jgi:hypothetical protein
MIILNVHAVAGARNGLAQTQGDRLCPRTDQPVRYGTSYAEKAGIKAKIFNRPSRFNRRCDAGRHCKFTRRQVWHLKVERDFVPAVRRESQRFEPGSQPRIIAEQNLSQSVADLKEDHRIAYRSGCGNSDAKDCVFSPFGNRYGMTKAILKNNSSDSAQRRARAAWQRLGQESLLRFRQRWSGKGRRRFSTAANPEGVGVFLIGAESRQIIVTHFLCAADTPKSAGIQPGRAVAQGRHRVGALILASAQEERGRVYRIAEPASV